MNKARRKEIAKAIDLMDRAREILEAVRDEEQDAFDSLPESLQDTAQGESMEEYIDMLEDCIDDLDTSNLQIIIDGEA